MKKLTLLLLLVGIAAAQCPITLRGYNTLIYTYPPSQSVKYTNHTQKIITGVKFRLVWVDSVDDPHLVLETVTSSRKVGIGKDATAAWSIKPEAREVARGWLLAPIKVVFEDGTSWVPTDNSCFIQRWYLSTHKNWASMPDIMPQ